MEDVEVVEMLEAEEVDGGGCCCCGGGDEISIVGAPPLAPPEANRKESLVEVPPDWRRRWANGRSYSMSHIRRRERI